MPTGKRQPSGAATIKILRDYFSGCTGKENERVPRGAVFFLINGAQSGKVGIFSAPSAEKQRNTNTLLNRVR